jgi:hypothetical protein
MERLGDDFIFLLDFGLKSNDFKVFGILPLGRLAGRVKYHTGLKRVFSRSNHNSKISWGKTPHWWIHRSTGMLRSNRFSTRTFI